jgi:hypothetical protein
MTEPTTGRKPARPALASRILAVGASAAATIGLVGAMVARAPTPAPKGTAVASTAPAPLHIVVVIKRPRVASPTVVSRSTVSARSPRIVRRYVTVAPVTTTHAS